MSVFSVCEGERKSTYVIRCRFLWHESTRVHAPALHNVELSRLIAISSEK